MPEREDTPFFSDIQRRLIGISVGLLAFLAIIALLVISFLVLAKVTGTFANVIWPLAVAGILAMMLRPLVGVFERRLHISRVLSVVILYVLVAIVLIGAILLIIPEIIRQVVEFAQAMPQLWKRAGAEIQQVYPGWVDLYNKAMENDTLRSAVESAIEQTRAAAMGILAGLKAAPATVLGIVGFVTNLAMVPVYLFFFLQSDEDPTKDLPEFLPFFKDSTREDVVFLVREFIGIVVAFFRGQLLIGLIMGVLLAIGFTVAGLEFGVVFGLAVGLLNIIPYLGTILGLGTVIPTAYLQADGGTTTVAFCLFVFVLVQLIEGYVLTPRIMGKQTGLHPVTIIIAIFFWGTALDGILGMVLAIPLTAFFVTAWRLAKHKYIKQLV